jgi:hypothetical protein
LVTGIANLSHHAADCPLRLFELRLEATGSRAPGRDKLSALCCLLKNRDRSLRGEMLGVWRLFVIFGPVSCPDLGKFLIQSITEISLAIGCHDILDFSLSPCRKEGVTAGRRRRTAAALYNDEIVAHQTALG